MTLREQMLWAVNKTELSHAEIARRSGIRYQYLNKLLNGQKSGKLETWDRILDACGLEVVSVSTKDSLLS